MEKPSLKPENPFFSCGPTAKRPGWSPDVLKSAVLARSHRSKEGKSRLLEVIERHRHLLKIPESYKIGITPASNTGAVEMAMWHLLGARGCDILAWESFGLDWVKDATEQLKLEDCRIFEANYGNIVDLNAVDTDRDIVFTWNGTTSGVRVPDANWIKDNREGLTICDATSAVFAYDLPWEKLDVVTWSWQKILGGEGAHGMIALSPRAIERFENYKPAWPLPKIFRIVKKGKVDEAFFEGSTLNTPSLMAVEDCLDALKWLEAEGGLDFSIRRTRENYQTIENWVKKTGWAAFLAEDPSIRSYTSICLKIVNPWFESLPEEARMPFIKKMTSLLEKENAAFDIASYRAAPAGIRIWGGATVEPENIAALLPWLDWAFEEAKAEEQQKQAA